MSTLSYDISMSVDGYVRAADPSTEEPLGAGGEALHEWAMGDDEAGREIIFDAISANGAVICGRRTYDDSMANGWGSDGPTGDARLPVIVVTHDVPADAPADGVYEFVTTGIEDALERAKSAAGGRDISLMGGPAVANQFLRAGLVDELSVHVAPVLFGSGTLLTEELPAPVRLEQLAQRATERAIHIRYRVNTVGA
jgi:dihydrofolate reductase